MLTGRNLVAGEWRAGADHFAATGAESGRPLDPPFVEASNRDVADACEAAAAAQSVFGALPGAARAAFLRRIAAEIEQLGPALIARAAEESGLAEARITGERARTVQQLRLFAEELDLGEWQGLRIDHADPGRSPPKPDLRLRKIPLGPVAVFGASNFPLAFSVAGGDTASAFAAGCCVVVKGHPAHPGTSELVAGAITRAISGCGLPAGVFSLLHSTRNAIGEALVRDPRIAAVGFTGSRAGGLALMHHAANRPVPIPVYAEMSSINPVILMPHRLDRDPDALAAGYVASLTLGAGQYCTNPGLVLALAGDALNRFIAAAGEQLRGACPLTMLTAGIRTAFADGLGRLAGLAGVMLVAQGPAGTATCGAAHLFTVAADRFLAEPAFAHEIFGPASIVVACRDMAELRSILEAIEGQLTATLQMDEEDHAMARELVPLLEQKAGRIIANGWPTGVEVTHAVVHGGPFPATSDGRSTSVGTLAIDRFVRPIAYQDMPAALLPEPLRDDAAGLPRRVDGARRD
ncbi:aldehyde dehydrogenase (NADP(+)) [Qipengyuania sp.]|uniref:aldehyde dehydrogenase (NADP(+)) n=1 Tax=Qipengyuania sp. TaxID=2004515 RepID=UPI003734CF20